MQNNASLKIDLGCGGCKPEGFVGVDRFPIPNVDVVADLNERLPFDDDAVSLLYSSHALEHVADLMSTMREIFRICKHGAQICIIAPYFDQKLNLANPYHLNVFNEHTPRFWTDWEVGPAETEDYYHPHADHWGLSRSDHSNPGLDLRLFKMEFFYFPAYRHLSTQQQRRYRQQRFDVCDQIMYHLVVWKPSSANSASMEEILSTLEPFEPPYIVHRKQIEAEELKKGFGGIQAALPENKELEIFQSLISISKQESERLNNHLSELMAQNRRLMEENQVLLAESGRIPALESRCELLKAEADSANILIETAQQEIDTCRLQFEGLKSNVVEKSHAVPLLNALLDENTTLKSSRRTFIPSFSSATESWDLIAPAFAEIKAFAALYFRKCRAAQVELSGDIRKHPYREYLVDGFSGTPKVMEFAISPLLPATQGIIGIEVVAENQNVVAQVERPLTEISAIGPTIFDLPKISVPLGDRWHLRLFVSDADVPVCAYEIVERRAFRRTANVLPFVNIRQ